jgi:hypothetical protein
MLMYSISCTYFIIPAHVFDVQESRSKVPALKINLNSKQPPQPHAFFEVSHSIKNTKRSHFIVFIFCWWKSV